MKKVDEWMSTPPHYLGEKSIEEVGEHTLEALLRVSMEKRTKGESIKKYQNHGFLHAGAGYLIE